MMNLQISQFEWLSLIAQGHVAFQLLYQGADLGLFEVLHRYGPLTTTEIAERLNLAPNPTRILLTGLTALKLLERDADSKYALSDLTTRYLIHESKENFLDVLGWQRHIVYPGIEDAGASLRANTNKGLEKLPGTGATLYQKLSTVPALQKTFQRAMTSLSKGNHDELLKHLPIGVHRRLVDCGGGDGTNAIALCQRNSRLNAIVFDQPDVCAMAAENIKKNDLEARARTHPGDLFTTEFPGDIDSILMSHLLTIWSPEKNLQLLKRAHSALPSHGRIYVFNMAVDSDELGPFSSALGSLYFQCIATGLGRLYRRDEFQGFLKAAGFINIKEQPLRNAHFMWSASKS